MAQNPVMPLWTDALIGDTQHLDPEEFGAYVRLLIATWRNNGRPLEDDDKRLALITGIPIRKFKTKTRAVLAAFFVIEGGYWRQKRLEKEWQYAVEKSTKQARRAASGWQNRAKNEAEMPHSPASDASHENEAVYNKNNDVGNATASAAAMPTHTHTHTHKEDNKTTTVIPAAREELAAKVVDHFMSERLRCWPNDPTPIPTSTARAVAEQWLEAGASYDVIAEAITMSMDRMVQQKQQAPRSLRFCHLTVDRMRANAAPVEFAKSANEAPAVSVSQDVIWKGRLDGLARNGLWLSSWGPKPGEPGCQVPKHLIEKDVA